MPEAYRLEDLDESAVRSGHADALARSNTGEEGSAAQAVARIELETYTAMARALGLNL